MESNLELIGDILYICEGSKCDNGMIELCNTDHKIINTFIKYLIEIHNVDKDKIHFRLQLKDYHDEEKCMQYWRDITNHPNVRFQKTNIIRVNYGSRQHKRKEYGLCSVRVNSSSLHREILKRCDMLLIN